MRRSQRLRNVAQLNGGELADIERRLAQVNRELVACEAQGQDLQVARDEYASRLQVNRGTAMSGSEARTLLTFLQRVDEAIAQLGEQIAVRRKAYLEYQQLWLMAKQKARVMNEIVERYEQAEVTAERRREQRESDDRPRPVRE
jgi:flagellar export protein FliJ